MSNIIPFRRPDADPKPVYVSAPGEDTTIERVQHAEEMAHRLAQLHKAIHDINSGKIKPDSLLILVEDDTAGDSSRLRYYTSGLNQLEMIGLMQTAAIAFAYDEAGDVTAQ